MTLRLVLVGLVAALGLTLPQWSKPTGGDEAVRPATIGKAKVHQFKTFHRPGRIEVADQRISRGVNAAEARKFQPVGFTSGVVRPGYKSAANFWQIPNGARMTKSNAPIVSALQSSRAESRYEPITVSEELEAGLAYALNRQSEGLSVELQGPPARLKIAKLTKRPIQGDDNSFCGLASALKQQAEELEALSLAENTTRIEFSPLRTFAPRMDVFRAIETVANDPALTVEVARVAEATPLSASPADRPDSETFMRSLKSRIEGIAADLGRQLDQAGQALLASSRPSQGQSDVVRHPEVADQVAVKNSPSIDEGDLPPDALADEKRDEIVARSPETAALADLPDNVFAEDERREQIAVEVAQASPLAELPEDVFAPAFPVLTRVETVTLGSESSARTMLRDHKAVAETKTDPDHLTRAVSLTRDAAVAWMKLLSGPAVVTLTR